MLLKHSAVYLVGRGLPGALGFLAIAVYTRMLSPGEYGVYALVVTAVALMNVTLFWWLRSAMLRFLHAKDPAWVTGTTLAIYLFLATAVLVVTLVLERLALLAAAVEPFVLAGAVLLLLQAFFELSLELARARLESVRYSALSVVRALVALLVGVALVVRGMGALGPILGQIAGMTAPLILGGAALWRGARVRFSPKLTREFLRYGAPLGMTFVMAYVVAFTDRFLIAAMRGSAPTGVYAAAYDLAFNGINLTSWIVGLAAVPLAIRTFEQAGADRARTQLIHNSRLLVAVVVPATLSLVMLQQDVVTVLLGERFRHGAPFILVASAVSAFMHSLRNQHFDLAYQIGQQTLPQFMIMGVAAAVNVLLNLALIPRYGLEGAATATVVAYALALLLSVVWGKRVWAIPFDLSSATKSVIFAIVGFGIAALVLEPLGVGPWSLLAKLLLGAVLYAALWAAALGGNVKRHFDAGGVEKSDE